MSVSSLREVTIGVADLHTRRSQLETGCGLFVLGTGLMTATTAWRLFDLPAPQPAAVMGGILPGSPRIRLVEASAHLPARSDQLQGPGPLGVVFQTIDMNRAQARLERADVRFLSKPITSPAPPANRGEGGVSTGRGELFGRTSDGDFIVLTEPLDASGAKLGGEPQQALFIVTNLDASVHFMKDVLGKDVGGGVAFLELEKRLTPPPQSPSFGRGVCRLRYDTTDLHATLARVPGGGGSLVRGPSGIDDPVLGRGLVALVRAPFGIVIELWQTA